MIGRLSGSAIAAVAVVMASWTAARFAAFSPKAALTAPNMSALAFQASRDAAGISWSVVALATSSASESRLSRSAIAWRASGLYRPGTRSRAVSSLTSAVTWRSMYWKSTRDRIGWTVRSPLRKGRGGRGIWTMSSTATKNANRMPTCQRT